MPRRWPQPSEISARPYRAEHARRDLESSAHLERAGFGFREGFRGAYAERRAYRAPRGRLRPPEPEGSGWPHRVIEVSPEAEDRHLRALRDRDLARSVDFALYSVLGRDADLISVYARDAVITLDGAASSRGAAARAVETAWAVPGVRRVRAALRPARRRRGRSRY